MINIPLFRGERSTHGRSRRRRLLSLFGCYRAACCLSTVICLFNMHAVFRFQNLQKSCARFFSASAACLFACPTRKINKLPVFCQFGIEFLPAFGRAAPNAMGGGNRVPIDVPSDNLCFNTRNECHLVLKIHHDKAKSVCHGSIRFCVSVVCARGA